VSPRKNEFQIYDKDYFSGAVHGYGFVNYEEDKLASMGYLKKYLKWLNKLGVGKDAKLLDVGAANGFFISLAERKGFNATGIELSEDAVEWAKKLGRRVFQSDAMSMSLSEKFDAITVLDVLEHLTQPEEFLARVKLNLNTNGFLLINVPNEGSFFAKLSGKSWHSYVPPEHLFYFNRKSLCSILSMNGYEIVKMRSISKTFKLSYIYKTIMHAPQIPTKFRKFFRIFNPIVNSKLGDLKIYLPLFDNLTVIAKVAK
jgi:2-polyprenyl-3-methyl-5-hydroxy-6-metoxy-1,4-benzoquinol methylase